jgi:hypothetical protein
MPRALHGIPIVRDLATPSPVSKLRRGITERWYPSGGDNENPRTAARPGPDQKRRISGGGGRSPTARMRSVVRQALHFEDRFFIGRAPLRNIVGPYTLYD